MSIHARQLPNAGSVPPALDQRPSNGQVPSPGVVRTPSVIGEMPGGAPSLSPSFQAPHDDAPKLSADQLHRSAIANSVKGFEDMMADRSKEAQDLIAVSAYRRTGSQHFLAVLLGSSLPDSRKKELIAMTVTRELPRGELARGSDKAALMVVTAIADAFPGQSHEAHEQRTRWLAEFGLGDEAPPRPNVDSKQPEASQSLAKASARFRDPTQLAALEQSAAFIGVAPASIVAEYQSTSLMLDARLCPGLSKGVSDFGAEKVSNQIRRWNQMQGSVPAKLYVSRPQGAAFLLERIPVLAMECHDGQIQIEVPAADAVNEGMVTQEAAKGFDSITWRYDVAVDNMPYLWFDQSDMAAWKKIVGL